ncbi:ATP-grasp domain-containing protein [Synechococcus sp. CB0205]|uniref:ATP-grasp domain-containing protein n=1 Tax=Synechococcus sp. CB0205 TaxID=232363 RepID=UPI0002002F73|nr:ATP-grasp domain-containing protein [Synechococcus sp. CB0205]
MNPPPTLLLSSAGRRVELLQALQQASRSLLGPEARVIATDLHPDLSAACALADGAYAMPRVTDPAFPDALLALCQEQGVVLVIPTIDTELLVLAQASSAFAAADVQVLISEPELVSACRDKRRTADLFAAIGLPSPAVLDPAHLRFPCFLKPVDGSCSQGVRPIPSEHHLTAAERSDPRNLFQELIPPHWQEYTVDAWYGRDGRLLAMVPRQRLETRGGEISKGITRKDGVISLLRPCLERIQGARGCLTVQVFTNPERDRLLGVEINPRFGGGYPLSHAAGVNFPELLIREWLLGETPSSIDDWQADLLMLRYDSMVLRADA